MEIEVQQKEIQNRIFTIRGAQVMIDRDLSDIYGVETKVLNQAVKRNIGRFPNLFRFQLTEYEKNELVTNCDQFEKLKHSSNLPYAFTEQGVAMLSAVLRSETAIEVSIQIINAFVNMRKLIINNEIIFQRLEKIDVKQMETDQKFEQIFKALERHNPILDNGIFFDGQVFDAYVFVSDLIKNAEKSIILLDNYIDESVLTLLSKRKIKAQAIVYTKQISKQLELDLKKHNQQYPAIEIKLLTDNHDRFIIIDEKELYHMGASLKDLGRKWFAFSKMDTLAKDVLNKLEI